jgi:ABC-type transporter Mla subunit MlaD
VNVGEVTEVEHLESASLPDQFKRGTPRGAVLVTMRLTEDPRPVHTDATLRLRPRLFLEGNYFIDLHPGTPSAPEADDGYIVPITNTSAPVQLDQVLTTLQADVREDLRTTLHELGNALRANGGAQGLRTFYRTAAPAFRSTSVVNQALLGTEPHDLSGLIRNLDRVVAALGSDPAQLQGLVENLDTVAATLAAEGRALERSVRDLPGTIDAARPALRAINGALPELRGFAIDALPGVRALPPAIDAATPFLRQVRGLVSKRELRGVTHDLRPTIPALAHLVRGTLPFLSEARAISSCFNETVIPWANMTVPDPETPATGRVFEETGYGLVGISGESRSADGNGPYVRVLGGSGTNFVVAPQVGGATDQLYGAPPLPLLGARPALDSSAKTPFRRDVACETNDPPNLDSGDAAAPPQTAMKLAAPPGTVDVTPALREALAGVAERLNPAFRLLGRERASASARREAGDTVKRSIAALNRTLAGALGWRGSPHFRMGAGE